MPIFKRARELLRSRSSRLRQLRQVALYLMKHIQMIGYCECLLTKDADDLPGCLLIVRTHQLIPAHERDLFQCYFQRKLTELGELGSLPLVVLIRDGNDLSKGRQQLMHVSSAQVASIIATANGTSALNPSVDHLAEMRKRIAAGRQKRAQNADQHPHLARRLKVVNHQREDDGYQATQQFSMTDVGQL